MTGNAEMDIRTIVWVSGCVGRGNVGGRRGESEPERFAKQKGPTKRPHLGLPRCQILQHNLHLKKNKILFFFFFSLCFSFECDNNIED